MTGAERKRRWRLAHPERSRLAERERAQFRRVEVWVWQRWSCEPGRTLKDQARASMISSYSRYEASSARYRQRLLYPALGPGAHRLTKRQLHAAIKARGRAKLAALIAQAEAEVGTAATRRLLRATGLRRDGRRKGGSRL